MLKFRTCTIFSLNRSELLLASHFPGTSAVQIRGRRRTLTPPPWCPSKETDIVKILNSEERASLEGLIDTKKTSAPPIWSNRNVRSSPIPWEKGEQVWTESSKRFGLIGRKIGMAPQWLTDGTRVLCTLIEIPENHVISAVDPATWFRTSSVGKRKAFTRFGPFWKVTIGAGNVSPAFLSDPYRRMFEKIGVPAKQTLGSFLVTEDAVIEPGTRLDVRHFSVGQFVNVTGKTIDWGFQGVVHRWGMKGQPKRNTTKAHRRVGSIGITSQAKVWLGKRLPGHMGYEWGTVRGLEVLRINPIKQVMYIKGAVPGDIGEMVLIKDIIVGAKRVQKPPFPTYCISEEEEKNGEQNSQLSTATAIISKDIYSPKLFNFTSPSIIFKDTDDVKSTARDRTKAKLAKVKK